MKTLTEDSEVLFEDYSDLTFKETHEATVVLYVKNLSVGNIKVWLDSEEADREYICINHEIVYLDTIEKQS
jgi:hypothetical protein